MKNTRFGLKTLFSMASIAVLFFIIAMPSAMAEKAGKTDSGHVMHDYADMSWPFHGDTKISERSNDKKAEHAKEATKEKKGKTKKGTSAKQHKKNDSKSVRVYDDMSWPFS